ncbi:MAG: alpha/beta fold hydrolase [Candidatus Binataceae bacterium]
MPTKYTDVKGHATYYFYHGATTLPDVVPDFSRGRAIVLVHGAGSNAHQWHRQIAALGQHHSPVALDLPGHGRSAGVEGLATVRDYADFVAAFMDALKLRSAVIYGHSMGGAIAMEMALRHPARVQALVLVATAAKFNLPPDLVESLRAVMMGRAPQAFTTDAYSPKTIKENFDVIREGWMEQIRTDPRVRYTDVAACMKVDLRDALANIDKPTLVVAGADDKGTPPADAEIIQSKIRGAKLVTIPDSGHVIVHERPAELQASVDSFLAGLK